MSILSKFLLRRIFPAMVIFLFGCVNSHGQTHPLSAKEFASKELKGFIAKSKFVGVYEVVNLEFNREPEEFTNNKMASVELKLISSVKGLPPLRYKTKTISPWNNIPSYYLSLKDYYSDVVDGKQGLVNSNRVEVQSASGERKQIAAFYKSYIYLITPDEENILYALPITSLNYDPIMEFLSNLDYIK